MFDDLIVERLRTAQVLQQQGIVPSIRAGLERVRDGDPGPGDLTTLQATTPFEQAVLERLAAQEEILRRLHEENRVLHNRLSELQQLPDINEGGREAELEQMNRYLLGELERRRLEAEEKEKRRGFWRRFWGRRWRDDRWSCKA